MKEKIIIEVSNKTASEYGYGKYINAIIDNTYLGVGLAGRKRERNKGGNQASKRESQIPPQQRTLTIKSCLQY